MSVPEFVVLIPARMQSSRLPNKPLADIAGLPMVVRVALQAKKSHAKEVVVACDDMRVVEACHQHNIQTCLTRVDHASGTDRIAEAVELMGWSDATIVINVQGDEPLIAPELINQLAAKMQDVKIQMATLAHPIEDAESFFNPNVVKLVKDVNDRVLYFSRAPIPYARDDFSLDKTKLPAHLNALRHIGLYAYRGEFLRKYAQLPLSNLESIEALEQLRVLYQGVDIYVDVVANAPAAGVDTIEDLERVRFYFESHKNTN